MLACACFTHRYIRHQCSVYASVNCSTSSQLSSNQVNKQFLSAAILVTKIPITIFWHTGDVSICITVLSLSQVFPVESLQDKAQKDVLKDLGLIADSRFCCGGVLNSPKNVRVVQDNGCQVCLPGADKTAIQQLVDCCSVASFGIGSKEVTDPSYRNALKLEPAQFTTSFLLTGTPILSEVRQLLVPQVQNIRAELYKLNVYGPGGHFKAHVDTPRSPEMFGSLVVCLPTQFAGGALSVRHRGNEVRFNWSSSAENPAEKIQWAAFFSDIEHEVLPVANGHRITLTYNLYRLERDETVDITHSPFYETLVAAMGNPHFLREGGVLGFACRHDYVLTDLNSKLTASLKGVDYNVYVAVKCLGLEVDVKPVVTAYCLEEKYLLPTFKENAESGGWCSEDILESDEELLKYVAEQTINCDNITWCCDEHKFETAATCATYGNEPGIASFYQSAAILIKLPKWTERHS